MLLKNESQLILQLKVDLVFDDNTKKDGIICVGDVVKLAYRRDAKRVEGIGTVRQITTSFNSSNAFKFFINPTILVDFSSNYSSNKVRIPVDDILDFEILSTGKYIPPFENIILHNLETGNIKIKKVYVLENKMLDDFHNLKMNDLVILKETDETTLYCANKLYMVMEDIFKYVMDIGDTKYEMIPEDKPKPSIKPDPKPDKPKYDCCCGNKHYSDTPAIITPIDPDDNPNNGSNIIVTPDKGTMDSDNPNIIPNLIILDNDNPNL